MLWMWPEEAHQDQLPAQRSGRSFRGSDRATTAAGVQAAACSVCSAVPLSTSEAAPVPAAAVPAAPVPAATPAAGPTAGQSGSGCEPARGESEAEEPPWSQPECQQQQQ